MDHSLKLGMSHSGLRLVRTTLPHRQRFRPLRVIQEEANNNNAALIELLQQSVAAHFVAEDVGPAPQVVADAWGRAWGERLAELLQTEPLQFQAPCEPALATCEATLVGVFHRDAVNLRFIREAVELAAPDTMALEARPSFLPCYAHLSQHLPDDLVEKLFAVPLDNLQDALSYVGLEDRLAWHEVLFVANDGLLRRQHRDHNNGQQVPPPHAPSPSRSSSFAAEDGDDVASSTSLSHTSSYMSPSSALTPQKVVSSFLARELALSEKVAAVWTAQQHGLPLYGIEVDEAAEYDGLLMGPLTAGETRFAKAQRRAFVGGAEDAGARLGTSAAGGAPHPGGSHHSSNASSGSDGKDCILGSGSSSGSSSGSCEPSVRELEAEQRRMALRFLEPEVAAAFEEWFRSLPHGDQHPVLQQQLTGLMPQCMAPASYLSYVDETDAMWSDERRVGRAMAAQHHRLTVLREEHFLRQLRTLAASGAPGGGTCRRLVAVVGRAHAVRLRRTLRLWQTASPSPPPEARRL